MTYIREISEYKKGRSRITLEDGTVWVLYPSEIRAYRLREKMEISDALFHEIQTDVIGKRAKMRAIHLLERTDRTEAGLRGKLMQNEYPPEAVDAAIAYVKDCHYLDDARFAANYIHGYQNSRSRKRIQMDLYARGISKEIAEQALTDEYEANELNLICRLLEKKGYNRDTADGKERQRMYAFLMRRGFQSEDILRAMNVGTLS